VVVDVLGHQLVLVEVVVGQREPADPVGAGQQDVDVVVDHQGDSTASTGCSSTMRGSLP
jgi:hypothetical protein